MQRTDCMLNEEQRRAWEQEKLETAATLAVVKEAAVAAMLGGAAAPDWAAEQIKTLFIEGGWWTNPIQEGWVVNEDDTIHISSVSSEPLQAGAPFTIDTEDDAKRLEGYGHKRAPAAEKPASLKRQLRASNQGWKPFAR